MDEKLEQNLKRLYLLKFFTNFLVLMPVIVPFFKQTGMGMKGVYILQSVFSLTVFLFEIPSGYLSDLYDRKTILILSYFFKGVGFSLFIISKDLNSFIVAEVILGIGLSLVSGTDTALLYDTLDLLKKKASHTAAFGKSLSYLTLGEGMAALFSTLFLYIGFSLNNLAALSALLSWITFVIAFSLESPARKKMTSTHRENFLMIYKRLFLESKLLKLIIFNSIFYFLGTLIAVWLFQDYWKNLKIPLVYFGLLWALTNLMASFSSRYAHLIEEKLGTNSTLLIIGGLPILGYFSISYFKSMTLGVLACCLFQVCRGLGQVLFKDAINGRVTSDFRATANSITQMGVRVSFILIGPLIGVLIDSRGLPWATKSLGVFYLFILIIVLIPLLLERRTSVDIT